MRRAEVDPGQVPSSSPATNPESSPSTAGAPADAGGITDAAIGAIRKVYRVTEHAIGRWRQLPLFAALAAATVAPPGSGTFDKLEAKRRFVAHMDWAARERPRDLENLLRDATGRKVSAAAVTAVYRQLVDFANEHGVTYSGAERIAYELRFDVSTVRRAQEALRRFEVAGGFDRWHSEDRDRWETGGYRTTIHVLRELPEPEDDGHAPRRRARRTPSSTSPSACSSTLTPASAPVRPSHGTVPQLSPRALVTPTGREAALSAIRAHDELAPLDNASDVDAITSAARQAKKSHLVAKALGEYARRIREGKFPGATRAIACGFVRGVLEPGQREADRRAVEDEAPLSPRSSALLLAQLAERQRQADAEANAKVERTRTERLRALAAMGQPMEAPEAFFAAPAALARLEARTGELDRETGPPPFPAAAS